jgi:hypothetical protein
MVGCLPFVMVADDPQAAFQFENRGSLQDEVNG